MINKKNIFIAAFCLVGIMPNSVAQDKLYSNTFPLGEVKLLDGPFKHACDLNVDVLLKYDVDRLLAPFLKEAGLTPKGESFPNWKDLDGHVGGHYLSALAIHYAATGNEACKQRMDYMLAELKRCQQKHGNGYVGGVPNGMVAWNEIKKGNVGIVWKYWVPWYNMHKIYAGLRDAWSYGGSEEARQMFLDLCDWGLTIIAPLNEEQMEQMLGNEFGGMDEVYADAYQMTGDLKYLDAAKRFSHHWLLDSMVAGVDNLDNKHANTQVPKVVGYQRIAELSDMAGREQDKSTYDSAACFFWNTVVNNRSLALGGNSRREHFPAATDCKSYVEDREGPESCNTNNMLKLTEGLFRMHPEARYADFYERAMFNHILSTQHPEHGGYVYFTSARPAHYRVYSAPNSAMWCCVGTGMENHGKYGEFIYTHHGDDLYVNLFVASELNWKEKGITLTQETSFPDEESSRLVLHVKKAVKAKLLIRHPWWCEAGAMKVVCRGKDYAVDSKPSSYIEIDRKWKDGDVIEITTPMKVTVEELPNVSNYIAIMRGPILLGARMGTEHLDGLIADDDRWGHIAHGPLVSVFDTPFIIGDRKTVLSKLENMQPVAGKKMCYTVPDLFTLKGEKLSDLVLEPFFRIHDCRYMMYWLSMNDAEYAEFQKAEREAEQRKLLLDQRTVDAVATAEQQPEVDHKMKYENSQTGHFQGEPWRDARDGGYFQYNLATDGKTDLSLMVRYWGNETSNRSFDILIDGELLVEENLVGKWNREELVNVEYPIPVNMLEGKSSITVTFRSKPGQIAGGVFYIRLLKKNIENE
ncbi:beta-L-arabinofuranosidase domain-containing protein [Bacteroides ndongoniae]|uniref:glycoside hydrolase family 127 protein n=1 Tax=Bacteroides ndongoniae TaxID=1903262 RepID=UPI0023F6B5C8|nr:beta-L-arabinofuranosidase domain-containing protein [Bacteroides ndongoniae]